MSSTEVPEPPSADDLDFFRAIEESFLELRGRTTLLGPEDFRVAQAWRHAGVPVELVRRIMSELFARQQQRKSKRGISSLRYFRAAVDAAWRERLELGAGGAPVEADAGPPISVRLTRLAAALPPEIEGHDRWADRIRMLAGGFEDVESALAALERELLDTLDASLAGGDRSAVAARVEQALARLPAPLSSTEHVEVAGRLRIQALRQRFALPLLSLFSPVALAEAPAGEG